MNKQEDKSRQPVNNEPPRHQIIPPKGEEYLRESANIEDMPSPAEDAEAQKVLREEQGPQNWFRI